MLSAKYCVIYSGFSVIEMEKWSYTKHSCNTFVVIWLPEFELQQNNLWLNVKYEWKQVPDLNWFFMKNAHLKGLCTRVNTTFALTH